MKIGICGKMCSGKSTLAKKIIEKYKTICGGEFVIDSFASKLYDIAYELFDMKEKDRPLLQKIGTKMREIDNDVWVNYIIQKHKETENIIIDDVRYSNELHALIKNGYFLIKLKISSELQEKRIKDLYKDNSDHHLINRNHLSEISLDNMDESKFNIVVHVDCDDIDTVVNKIMSIQLSSLFSPVLQ